MEEILPKVLSLCYCTDRRGAKPMLSKLFWALFKNQLNMQQYQLKLSPVSDSASIPIQEAIPKQRKSWLHLWENHFHPFKDPYARTEKAPEVPWQLQGWRKQFFGPSRFLQELRNES